MENLKTYIKEGLLTSPPGDMHKEGMQMLHQQELQKYIVGYGDLYIGDKHFDKYIEFIDENTINFGHETYSNEVAGDFRIYDDSVQPRYRQPSWLKINKFSGYLFLFFKNNSIKAPECWPSSFYDISSIEMKLWPGVRSLKGFRMDFDRPDGPVYINLRNNDVYAIDIPYLDMEISGRARRVNIILEGNLGDWKILRGIKNRSGIPGTLRILDDSDCWGRELDWGWLVAGMDNYIQADQIADQICETLNKNIPDWITCVELSQYAADGVSIKSKVIDVGGSQRFVSLIRKGGKKGAEFELKYY